VLWPVSGVLMLALCVGSWVSIRDGARELATQREIIRLRDEWRAFVHECPAGKTWRVIDGVFAAGPLKAEAGPGRVAFRLDVGEKVLSLPPGMQAEFGVDQVKGFAPVAVLTLTWTSSRAGLKRDDVVPMVACAELPAQSRGLSGIGQ